MSVIRSASVVMLGLGLLLAGLASAEGFTPAKSAEQSVIEGVEQVLTVVEKYNSGSAGDRQAYLDEVAEVLEPLIGYTVIVSRIMGDTLQTATNEQKLRFLDVFKRSMINTYAGGLYNFGAYDVRLVPDQDSEENTVRNTRVRLEAVSPQGQRYPMIQSVYYSQASDGWKMQNVIFNGINLGVTFKTQFDQIYREQGGDLDATIDEWERITAESYETSQFQ
ncbi:MlaC/ttg2D family ABC transporter substrate-binding protein [Saccharospirillum mangrovi]|uniref:MlaC/ttg2D family ABC transporter substrate-binding protein n=1 Tax=Saccharospirillum mangrovi TaxID=2161747 RepID=UPI000D3616C4|nr:ABC transporter substrate-binding protein [Saccharospirillum mangrovi]